MGEVALRHDSPMDAGSETQRRRWDTAGLASHQAWSATIAVRVSDPNFPESLSSPGWPALRRRPGGTHSLLGSGMSDSAAPSFHREPNSRAAIGKTSLHALVFDRPSGWRRFTAQRLTEAWPSSAANDLQHEPNVDHVIGHNCWQPAQQTHVLSPFGFATCSAGSL